MANKTKQSHKRNAIDLRTKRSGSRVIEFFGPISTLTLSLPRSSIDDLVFSVFPQILLN